MCHGFSSTSSTSSVYHVGADLTDNLIHQIIALLSSFHDFLAFTGTCRSWRAAASSFSSAYTFTFPPLHLKPDFCYTRKRSNLGVFSLLHDCKWLLGDPAKRNISLLCSVPRNSPNCLLYLGRSYGYLIFSYREHCLLADVYTGTKVKPPKIQSSSGLEIYCGFLVAPISSPSSRLLLFSKASMFQWQVGANLRAPSRAWWCRDHADCHVRFLPWTFLKGYTSYNWHLSSACRKCKIFWERTWMLACMTSHGWWPVVTRFSWLSSR